MAERTSTRSQRVTIKKYANRRLYNTASSAYVTLDYLAELIKKGTDFAVFDARTGEDITRSVLMQIVLDEDSKGHGMLPTAFLRQLICFSGDPLEALVARYLEKAMEELARNKTVLSRHIQNSLDGLFPLAPLAATADGDIVELEQLREQLSRMQQQIDTLARRSRQG
jgi:polyhydroxyalkanoate synthesis repressor PhaR